MAAALASFDDRWSAAQQRYSGTIHTFARNSINQLSGHMGMDDIEQELLVVLWKCVLNYDPNRGASFNTLFQGCAKRRIISLIRTTQTASRKGLAVSLDEEAVARAVEEMFERDSAEDVALRRMELKELVATHGPEVFSARGKRSR